MKSMDTDFNLPDLQGDQQYQICSKILLFVTYNKLIQFCFLGISEQNNLNAIHIDRNTHDLVVCLRKKTLFIGSQTRLKLSPLWACLATRASSNCLICSCLRENMLMNIMKESHLPKKRNPSAGMSLSPVALRWFWKVNYELETWGRIFQSTPSPPPSWFVFGRFLQSLSRFFSDWIFPHVICFYLKNNLFLMILCLLLTPSCLTLI